MQKNHSHWTRITKCILLTVVAVGVVFAFFMLKSGSVAFGALSAAIFTFSLNEVSKELIIIRNEKSIINLYYSEIDDLIRHLEAGTEVLIQLHKEFGQGARRAANIHFVNLQWPETSIIFSDDMAKLITKSRVNDLTRLKMNIRNLNNYARWLQELAEKEAPLQEPIQWVITRHIDYIINLCYMVESDYHFPSDKEELKRYIENGTIKGEGIKDRLSKLFMDYSEEDRITSVNKFLDIYIADREDKRKVFVE